MKEYFSPKVEFIELEGMDIMTISECPEHVCEVDYGNICDGREVHD